MGRKYSDYIKHSLGQVKKLLGSLINIFLSFILLPFRLGFGVLKIIFGLLGIVAFIGLAPLLLPVLAALGVGTLIVAAAPILVIGVLFLAFKLIF